VLEKVSLSGEQLFALLRELREEPTLREAACLSTCNRTEFYVVAEDTDAARHALLERLEAHRPHAGREGLGSYGFTHREEAAARHLFRVAAGIDSLVIGESEILGQVRRAHEVGLNAGTVRGTLNTLMQRALSFGRRVRVETNISRGNVSVASVAHRVVRSSIPNLQEKTLLVLGAGETARAAALLFRAEGIGEIYVLNRTPAHSEALAEELGGRALPIERLESGLELADVVLCAVGAPHHVITRRGLADIMARRHDRPMELIDISMPRNIDPECATLDSVSLHAIDSLEAIAAENRAQRENEIAVVEQLVEAETSQFLSAVTQSGAARLAVVIRRRNEQIRQQLLARHGRSMSEAELEKVTRFSESLLRSVFHEMATNLRSLDLDTNEGDRDFEAIRRLFNVPLDALGDE
jgi:glutamyl-tRNA reductase